MLTPAPNTAFKLIASINFDTAEFKQINCRSHFIVLKFGTKVLRTRNFDEVRRLRILSSRMNLITQQYRIDRSGTSESEALYRYMQCSQSLVAVIGSFVSSSSII
jgi:hypothetical protein